MKILLTGDMGHLGGRARRLLEERGHEVVGFDVQRSPEENIANIDLLVEKAQDCEAVIHAAAIPRPHLGGMGDYFMVNVAGTFNALEAAACAQARRFVYVSSTGYYGCDIDGVLRPLYLPIDEAHPSASLPGRSKGALDAYDRSKVMAEELCAWYGTNRVFEVIALRIAPANPKSWQYSEGYDWRADDGWKRGCFYSNCHPDYAAQAMVCAAETKGSFWYEPFNVTDLYTHGSIYIDEVVEELFPDAPLIIPEGGLHPHASLVTPRKAMELLGFEPCEDLE